MEITPNRHDNVIIWKSAKKRIKIAKINIKNIFYILYIFNFILYIILFYIYI